MARTLSPRFFALLRRFSSSVVIALRKVTDGARQTCVDADSKLIRSDYPMGSQLEGVVRRGVSVASEAPRQLDVERVEVDVADALEELGGPGIPPGTRGAVRATPRIRLAAAGAPRPRRSTFHFRGSRVGSPLRPALDVPRQLDVEGIQVDCRRRPRADRGLSGVCQGSRIG